MRYPRNPYRMNTYYKNEIAKGNVFVAEQSSKELSDPDSVELLDKIYENIMMRSDVPSIFQVGYGFGDILLSISNLYPHTTACGIEFDPMIPAYANNFFPLYENRKLKLEIGIGLEEWKVFGDEYDVVFATDWVKALPEQAMKELFHKMTNLAKSWVIFPRTGTDIDFLDTAGNEDSSFILVDTTELETTVKQKPSPEEVIIHGKDILQTPDIDKEPTDVRSDEEEGYGDGWNVDDRTFDLPSTEGEEGES